MEDDWIYKEVVGSGSHSSTIACGICRSLYPDIDPGREEECVECQLGREAGDLSDEGRSKC